MHAYHIGGKSQSNGIRYRYRRTHIGTLKLNHIYVDRIDLISLVAVTYDTPILSHSHVTDAPRISHNVKYLASKKDRQSIECFNRHPRFRIHYVSR